MEKNLLLYDTTLRDGSQRQGISYSLEDKLSIAGILDGVGVHYIEGGWPGSNPKDQEFFRQVRSRSFRNARVCAFGSTRRAGVKAQEDLNLRALLEADTPVVTLVGKSSPFQVEEVLRTSLDENLHMISESVSWMERRGREVVYDAEHFFDGFKRNEEYALKTLQAAYEAGASTLVLCDTNGGTLPEEIQSIVTVVQNHLSARLGIHTHNDSELAVANSLAAIRSGCVHVQGTINGYGERCGNANLISVIANAQLKLGYHCIPSEGLSRLTTLSRKVSEIANLLPDDHAAFVGKNAFAHKGGIHVAAVERNPESYEHISPESVGNKRRFLLSELSGRGNIRMLTKDLGLDFRGEAGEILEKVKKLEADGFQFESAEGSFELLMRREEPDYVAPFTVEEARVLSVDGEESSARVEAVVKVRIGEELFHTVSEGDGPVHALDGALRKALAPVFPEVKDIRLVDYKVRILDPENATAATTRVLLEACAPEERWTTIGVSHNIISASLHALVESLELFLNRRLAEGGSEWALEPKKVV